jgi:transposase, IS5 family
LLAKGVAKLARLTRQVHIAGLATRTKARDRTRSVRRRVHDIGAGLRRRSDQAKTEVLAINREVAGIAEHAVADARRVARNARRGLRHSTLATGKTVALLAELERTATLVERVAAQTRVRLSGGVPDGSVRVVSLHDPDARPITKGRLGRPVEFGYTAQVVDNADGVVLDHGVHVGNPPDAPLLAPAIGRIAARFGHVLRVVTADRGYGEAAVERDLQDLGVTRVVIPRKGRPGAARQAIERRRSFRKLVKWRTGSEARISCLKRDYGWRRTLTESHTGTATWCGWGVLAHTPPRSAPSPSKPNDNALDPPTPARSPGRRPPDMRRSPAPTTTSWRRNGCPATTSAPGTRRNRTGPGAAPHHPVRARPGRSPTSTSSGRSS